VGCPRQGLLLRASDALLIPFSLLWAGFAVFWESSVILTGAPLFFLVWGVPFVLAGAYIVIGRFIIDARRRARTAYGVTDQRALIVSGWFSREVRSLPLRTLSELSLSERRDGSGTIRFGRGDSRMGWMGDPSWPGAAKMSPPAFEMIPEARRVYEHIQQAQTISADGADER
jgi:hypothetical protein